MTDSDRRIRSFFDWYRARVVNLDRSEEVGDAFAPERHVLLAAGIDSLAKFWAQLYPELLSDQAHPALTARLKQLK